MKVSTVMKKENSKGVSIKTLQYIQNNVLNITDVTRTNKLSQILDLYSKKESTEVYIIRNNRNKEAAGVLIDFRYFEHLLRMQELIENMVDEHMLKIVMERKNDTCNLEMESVIEEGDFSLDALLARSDALEIEDD